MVCVISVWAAHPRGGSPINRDNTAWPSQPMQQFRDGRDFVGFLYYRHWPQRQALLCGPDHGGVWTSTATTTCGRGTTRPSIQRANSMHAADAGTHREAQHVHQSVAPPEGSAGIFQFSYQRLPGNRVFFVHVCCFVCSGPFPVLSPLHLISGLCDCPGESSMPIGPGCALPGGWRPYPLGDHSSIFGNRKTCRTPR